MKKRMLFTWLVLALALTGCMKVGPEYVRPEVRTQAKWNQPADPALVPTREEIKAWWKVFNDPLLTQLIEQAGKSNLDIRAALARVKEARAQLGVVSGQQLPEVNTTGDVLRQENSRNAGLPGGARGLYSLGLDAGWELDLFGRIARSVEAASAQYQATEEDLVDVMITLYAEVARTYLNARTFQARLATSSGNIESQRGILKLTKIRFEHGLTTGLDVAQAERVLANSEADLPPLKIALAQAVNALGVLLGRPPDSLWNTLREARPIPIPPDKVSITAPANLLRQRPDIRRAERLLAAQTARVGVAAADLYPSFSLIGTFGFQSFNSNDLFTQDSRFFSLGPSFTWNLFDGGRIRSQIKVEDARTEQALLNYEQTVLKALNEAENAMTSYLEQRIRVQALTRAAKASQRSLHLATSLYKDGLADFQNVLDAQRSVFDVENQLAEAKGQAAVNMVLVYKTMGGGWSPEDLDKAKTGRHKRLSAEAPAARGAENDQRHPD